jgi:hypothetical protein
MLSPFTTVDHRIDSFLPLEERRVLRRSAPERLRFEPPGPALIPVALEPVPQPLRRPSRLRVWLGEAPRVVTRGRPAPWPRVVAEP